MPSGLTVDGFDLDALGITVESVSGHRSPADRVYPIATVDGRDDAIVLSEEGMIRPRRITVNAIQKVPVGGTVETLMGYRDELLYRVSRREVSLIFSDQSSRYIIGRAEPIDFALIRPDLIQRGHRLVITFLCADPRWYETSNTVVSFSGGSGVLPLGSAPSRGVITITGPVSPFFLTFRNYLGAEVSRMEFLGESLGGGDVLSIDSQKLTIVDQNGDNAADKMTGGTFLRLDPQHAQSLTGTMPSIQISSSPASANISYRRAWL